MNMGNYKVVHGKDGRYVSLKRYLLKMAAFWLFIIGTLWFFIYGHPIVIEKLSSMMTNTVYAQAATSTPEKSDAEVLRGLPLSVLEDKLDAIVWNIESNSKTMKDGETFMTFDPPLSWPLEKCTKRGGKANLECYSFGPRQEKVPTIQSNWKQLHGEVISESDARAVAEGNESSKRFFLDCSIKIKGCVKNWTSATMVVNGEVVVKPQVQMLLDLIREAMLIDLTSEVK